MPVPAGQDGVVGSAGGPRADRPRRRRFTAAYKMEILAEYDRLTDSGERGALLRVVASGRVVSLARAAGAGGA